MAYKVHEIVNYAYNFDARLGAIGKLQLFSATSQIALINFVDDTATVPAPVLAADLNSATAYFKRSASAGLVDMLRNEKPVSVTINNQGSGFVFVHTGMEATGEGES